MEDGRVARPFFQSDSSDFPPILPLQTLDPTKLPRIRGNQSQLVSQSLSGNQQIVSSDWFSN